MSRLASVLAAVTLCAGFPLAASADDEPDEKVTKRLENCNIVLNEVMGVPENVPRDLLDKAECVAVIPGV